MHVQKRFVDCLFDFITETESVKTNYFYFKVLLLTGQKLNERLSKCVQDFIQQSYKHFSMFGQKLSSYLSGWEGSLKWEYLRAMKKKMKRVVNVRVSVRVALWAGFHQPLSHVAWDAATLLLCGAIVEWEIN